MLMTLNETQKQNMPFHGLECVKHCYQELMKAGTS